MRIDPSANRILIDYVELTERFGYLDFGEFMTLWHVADVLMTAEREAGFEPSDVPDLIIDACN